MMKTMANTLAALAALALAAAPALAQTTLLDLDTPAALDAAFGGGGGGFHPPAPRPMPPAPRPAPPEPRPMPPSPRPQPPSPRPAPPSPRPIPPGPRPGPVPGPRPDPWPHQGPRPFPVPVAIVWPYNVLVPPCPGGCASDSYFVSPDGSRAVWIEGDAHDAFLYDRTGTAGFDSVWLDWEVSYADFETNPDGTLAAIVLAREDGVTEYFDPNGNPLSGDPQAGFEAQSVKPAAAASRDLSQGLQKSAAYQALSSGNLGW